MDIKLQIIFFILLAVAILGVLFCSIWIFNTDKRLKRFFLGKKAKDLEDVIVALQNELAKINESQNSIKKEITLVNVKIKKSIRGLETIRFNPFPDQGGNQSFAVSMLNEEGDGLILSSLYSRERMSVFAKPVKNGKSEYELTAEEKEALQKAKV
jgi:hypothetical protein